MDSIFLRPFEEEFARLTIGTCFPELNWVTELNKDDPPDIIDKEHDIGIEVTHSISELDAQLSSAFADNKGRRKSEVKEGLLKKVDTDTYGFICDTDNPDAIIIGASYPVKSELYGEVKRALIKKTKKLNGGKYPQFKTDVLFILNSDGFCFKDGLKLAIEEAESELSCFDRFFTIVFVYCGNEIYCYQTGKEVRKKEIASSTSESIKEQALINIGRGKR